jgi:hypothetical protein
VHLDISVTTGLFSWWELGLQKCIF